MRARILLFMVIVSIFSCNKEDKPAADNYVYISGSGLTGKWLAKQRFVSPGGGGQWYDLAPAEWFVIEFKSDSSISYSANFPKADSLFSQYSLSGHVIKVSSLVNSKTDTWLYDVDMYDRLQLSTVLCIEGCPYGLRRIQ